MPRRSGGGMRSAPSRSYSTPAPRPAPRPAPVPAHPPPAAPAPVAAQPQQPGMFAQMATTAAGVAVGSAVGHTIGHAMTGGGGGGHQEAAPAPVESKPMYQQQPYQTQDQQAGPCQMEMKQFMDCAQTQGDLTLCQGFNEALRQCKLSYGMPLQ